MYHLTCPTCSNLTESPFVRSGAVVRCPECRQKYRIKSAHFERVVLTGPRTLDETDSVLRSDSVDIDPDEVAPVSIDDEGNVVGLSGLSELMRWSDQQGQKDKLQHRADTEPPPARVSRTAKLSRADTPHDIDPDDVGGRVRARAMARRRKKRNNMLIIGGMGLLLLISIGVIVALMVTRGGGGETGEAATDPGGTQAPGGTQMQDTPANNNSNTTPTPRDPGDSTDTGPNPADGSSSQNEGESTDPVLFDIPNAPTRVEEVQFIPPWANEDPDALPVDVPTVLTPSTQVVYEGWYVMRPPRGAADALGEADVRLGELVPTPLDEDQTLLVGAVTNRSDLTVLSGELHVMLLDSTGSVFAETYTPLVMIEPGAQQSIALPIASRHWQRQRGYRAGVTVIDWIEQLTPLEGVQVDPVGSGENAAVRVSVRHTGNKPLRNVLIVISAMDEQGDTAARFVVGEENLYVAPGGWLDLVVATPLEDWQDGVRWSAIVQPR